jgi:hypothetical protein
MAAAADRATPPGETHALTNMPGRFYCTCGYGMEGPKRTVRGLRTHITRSNAVEAGERARKGMR